MYMDYVIESERLFLRKIREDDFKSLREILKDGETMYAWEGGFTDEEVRVWIGKNIERYKKDGYSYFIGIDKATGNTIGLMGPLIEEIEGEDHIGIAYIVDKKYWNLGYGYEGAKASLNYAFDVLGAKEVIAEIRPNNTGSLKLAKKLGMKEVSQFNKKFKGRDILHLIYSIEKNLS